MSAGRMSSQKGANVACQGPGRFERGTHVYAIWSGDGDSCTVSTHTLQRGMNQSRQDGTCAFALQAWTAYFHSSTGANS